MVNDPSLHPLRRWRKSRGLTMDAAADLVGVTRQSWHAWEHAKRVPSVPMIRKLCAIADVCPSVFFDRAAA